MLSLQAAEKSAESGPALYAIPYLDSAMIIGKFIFSQVNIFVPEQDDGSMLSMKQTDSCRPVLNHL